jgi:hypothetical protein
MKRIVTLFSFLLLSIFISHAQYIWVGNNSYGGYSLPNNITIAANASNCFIGGLNTSGTNTFAADILLNSSTQLESFAGGIAQFTSNKSGPQGITIDDVGESGNGIVQYSGVPKTYTGVTIINNGATFRISSNQSLEDIVLNTGGKLIVDAGVKLTVNGSWTGGGELENNGTIELIGGNFFPGSATTVTAMNILQVNRSGTVNLDNNLTITGSLILTAGNFDINPGRVLTLNDANLVNATGFLVGSSTSDLIVTGASGGTVLINNAITLRNILVDGTRTVSLNGTNDLTLYGNLNITANATFNSGGNTSQITNNGAAAINLSGTFITQHPGGFIGTGSAIPTVPVTINNNSTVDFGRLGDQQITATPSYFNIRFSGSGIKTPDNAISVHTNGLVSITGTCTVDATNKNIGSTGPNTTAFQMSSGIFKVGTAETLPLMRGTYTITGGTIQYVGASSKNIRSTAAYDYQNIEILGTNVNNGAGNISLNANGTFTIKNGGVFSINSNAIIGPFGNETITIESGGRFNCSNIQGFYGPSVSGNSPSIRDNIENLILQPGSTVVYSRADPPLTGGNQVITNTNSYQNLELSGSGVKTAPTGTLTIQGNLTKSGTSTFAHNNGLVLLDGTSQSFAGLDFYGLEMTGGTKTTNGDASIDSVITINSNAVLNIRNGDSITLKSSTTRTASIDKLLHANPSAAITYNGTGKFVVERSLYTGRKWRLLSAPTHGQTIRESWQEGGSNVSGYGFKAFDTRADFATRGFDALGSNTSIQKYSPSTNTWGAVDNTHLSINTERGYMVFVAGDFTASFPNSNATKLRTSGQLFTGTQVPITIDANKFALLGNPYASNIDLKKLNISGDSLVAEAVYVWDPSATGSYGVGNWYTLFKNDDGDYVNDIFGSEIYGPAGTVNNFIESGQAFFVRGGTTTSTITFEENDKTSERRSAGSTVSSFTAGASQSIKAILNLVPATGSPIALDGVKADFSDSYSNNINGYDIRKMGTLNESVSWKTNDSMLVVDRRAMIVNNDTLHLNNRNYKLQNYQWKITSNNLDYPGRTGFLVDRYKGTVTPLNMAGITTINFSVQNIVGSYASDRFKIVFNQVVAGPLPVTITTVAATRNTSVNNEVTVSWKVESETNMNNYEVEYSADGSNFSSIATIAPNSNNGSGAYSFLNKKATAAEHFYRIKANSIGGLVQYSAIVKVAGIKASANSSISVYPNPVVNKKMNVQFVNQAEGNYQVSLFSNNGALVYKNNVTVNSSNLVKVLPLHDNVAAGNYQMIVTDAAGNTKTQSVIVL